MNNWNGIGRICNGLELRYTKNNKAFMNLNIAINRYVKEKQETDFISVRVWDKAAENINMYLKKGSMIGIEGSIRTESYETSDGQRRNYTYVLANRVIFLDSKKEASEEKETQDDPFADFQSQIELDDDFLE